jgi:hypothetical protein
MKKETPVIVRTTRWSSAILALAFVALASGRPAGAAVPAFRASHLVATPAEASTWAQRHNYKEIYQVVPPDGVDMATVDKQAITGQTVPLWSSSIVSPVNHVKYNFKMVGSSPLATQKSSTTVKFVLVELRFHFSNGVVLSPILPGCNDSRSVVSRVLNSPIIASNIDYSSNGQNVGKTQFEDAFQRANFWKYVKGTNYHVVLKQASTILFDVTVPSNEGFTQSQGNCPPLGEVNFNWFDAGYKAALKQFVDKPGELAFGINYNTVLYSNSPSNCCTLGYHGSIGVNGGSATQTYSDSAYVDQGIFNGWNTATLSHEIGEWMDDPLGNNPTPAWGHIGQVSGCQGNLEVGDPLSGTTFNVTDNGFTYEVQDLAFFSWFYRQSPSIGTGGFYSLGGTFTHGAGPICH